MLLRLHAARWGSKLLPRVLKKWCHMCCRLYDPKISKFGNPTTCFGKGLGVGICKIYYHCRFKTGDDGKRQLRDHFYLLGILASLFYPFYMLLYFVLAPFVWTTRFVLSLKISCIAFIEWPFMFPFLEILSIFFGASLLIWMILQCRQDFMCLTTCIFSGSKV